ncbi:hypothetical protein [Streptomyces sp. NBC_01462]|uniref:hypothetical protein n=1 Tax=Streptomyces sp. NBC_01462 TaxID=2903876 RepID=UPI002E34D6B5|nr:hypothetical protein [Streptomyces sp. NBC_01462]
MDESNAKDQPKHPFRWVRRCTGIVHRLRKWISQQGPNIPGEFLQGVAYKLGSGTVTLLILWWESRG